MMVIRFGLICLVLYVNSGLVWLKLVIILFVMNRMLRCWYVLCIVFS